MISVFSRFVCLAALLALTAISRGETLPAESAPPEAAKSKGSKLVFQPGAEASDEAAADAAMPVSIPPQSLDPAVRKQVETFFPRWKKRRLKRLTTRF